MRGIAGMSGGTESEGVIISRRVPLDVDSQQTRRADKARAPPVTNTLICEIPIASTVSRHLAPMGVVEATDATSTRQVRAPEARANAPNSAAISAQYSNQRISYGLGKLRSRGDWGFFVGPVLSPFSFTSTESMRR